MEKRNTLVLFFHEINERRNSFGANSALVMARWPFVQTFSLTLPGSEA
jgi:hypothetical protein